MQRLLRHHRRLPLLSSRNFATTSNKTSTATPKTITDILHKACISHPQKDAIKHFETTDNTILIWTYRDLLTHVHAITTGLHELGYTSNDTIVLWLPSGSVEYMTMVLAGMRLGIKVVVVDGEKGVEEVKRTIGKYGAKGVVLWHGYGGGDDVGRGVVKRVFGEDFEKMGGKGLRGFVKGGVGGEGVEGLEGSLKHVVHTGNDWVRGTICFKSLMVYHGEKEDGGERMGKLVDGGSGVEVGEGALVDKARGVANGLGLSSRHEEKKGKVVVNGKAGIQTVTGLVAALLNESLLVSSSFEKSTEKTMTVAESENAVIYN